MANMRKDDNNVYIDLWGETLEFNKTEYALYQLSTAFEVRVANDIKTIVDKRVHGKAIENFKQVGNEVSFQFLPWIYDNIDYVKNTIKTSSALVKSILSQYDIDLTPNWNEINKKWLEQVEKIRQIYVSAMNETIDALKRNDEIRYQQAYNEELSRDFGLSFGIISNSLVSHLLYAAQSASKEAKDHKRAAKYAYENSGDTLEESTTKILNVVYPLYTDKMEPALTKLLSEYYAYIVSIFSKELNCPYDDVAITFDFNRSNAFILGVSENAKANVLGALEAYPNNGNVIGYAIKNGVLDDELCEYGKNAPEKFGIILKKWAISVLSEIYSAGKLFNKPLVTDENKAIIEGLIKYYDYIEDDALGADDWQEILSEVYGDELTEVSDLFDIFDDLKESNANITRYAQTNKKLVISDEMIKRFITACQIKDGSCSWYAINMDLDTDRTITVQQVRECIIVINSKIDEEIVVLKNKAEQRRAEEERRKAEEQKRKEEEQRQKDLVKARNKKIFLIVASTVTAIIIFVILLNSVIIPNGKYNDAVDLMNNGQYDSAIKAFEALDGYKDSDTQIKECRYLFAVEAQNNKDYDTAYTTFVELEKYSDSSSKALACAVEAAEYSMSKKQYDQAVKWYNLANKTDEVKNAKYQYVQSHKNSTDTTTYQYLRDLKWSSYKDAESIYNQLYAIQLEYVINDSPTDVTTHKTEFKYVSSYYGGAIYIHVRLTGGYPGQSTWVETDGWHLDSELVKCNGEWYTLTDDMWLTYGQSSSDTTITIKVRETKIVEECTITVYK